jgi:signal peptidase I
MTNRRAAAPLPAVAEKPRWRQNVESIALALLIALAVRSSVVQAFWVPSGSMLPTIQIGDHIFVNKLAYSVRVPLIGTELLKVGDLQRDDVVVFVSPIDPSTDLIKRVVAVPGDTVEIRSKQLYVNGEKVSDPHAHFTDSTITPGGQRDNMPAKTVPEGKFFVMGDNRDRSFDSRFWGFANIDDIKGKATFVYWSRDVSQGWLAAPRFSRFGTYID